MAIDEPAVQNLVGLAQTRDDGDRKQIVAELRGFAAIADRNPGQYMVWSAETLHEAIRRIVGLTEMQP